MTVSSTTTKVSYAGNGSTTAFSAPFYFILASDLKVTLRSATGTETVKTLTTNYTVSGAGVSSGGTVTMLVAPASGETLVIQRNVPLTQEVDYQANDPFPAATHEAALDKLTMETQQLNEALARSLKISTTNTMTSTEFTVNAATRANKVLGFDAAGELSVTQELGTYRSSWSSGTAYAQRDIVKDTSNNNIYICTTAHTSTGAQPISTNAGVANWSLLVDSASATSSAAAAASSASAASTSATTATTQAATAATQASAAATSATNAAASATAATTNGAAQVALATTQAGNAATSATAASGSASAAATSATNAAASATAAATSAATVGFTATSTTTFQNKTIDNTNAITVKDANFTIQDDGDTTKILKIQASGISTGTTRTLTPQDADTTIAGININQSFTKAQRGLVSALTDGATITPDFSAANNYSLTLGGNRTLANPTNITAGQSGTIVISQDGTGSRTLAYGSYWKFPGGTAPTLTTAASAVDVLVYYVESATRITARVLLDVK